MKHLSGRYGSFVQYSDSLHWIFRTLWSRDNDDGSHKGGTASVNVSNEFLAIHGPDLGSKILFDHVRKMNLNKYY